MRPRHPACHPLPKLWLMTDERMGDQLIAAICALPKGKAGIVFRHYKTAPSQRRRLFESIKAIARRNRLILLLADRPATARLWNADGWHGNHRGRHRQAIHSMAVHNQAEMHRAIAAKADLVFLSPLFATRSHPGAAALGSVRFASLARQAPMPVIALGGMTSNRFRIAKNAGAYGYAAIDAWMPETRPGKRRA